MGLNISNLDLLALQEIDRVIEVFKTLFARNNPDAPVPTSDEIIAAFNLAYVSSLTKDDNWLHTHPEQS